MIKIISKDFYILDESIVYEEIAKCFPCLTSEQDMTMGKSLADNRIPENVWTILNLDIESGLPLTSANYRYIYSCCDTLSGYFLAASGKSRKPIEIMNFFKNSIF